MKKIKLPAAAEKLIPHRSPMLLIDELSAYSEKEIKGTASIRTTNPFINGASIVDSNGLVEIMAQTVAAGNGYYSKTIGKPIKAGFLVGLSDFRILGSAKVGELLNIEIMQESKVGQFSIVKGRLLQKENCIASGIIKIFELEGDIPPPPPSDDEDQEWPDQCGNRLKGVDYSSISKELLSNLYKLEINRSEGNASCQFGIDKSFIGFQGHFPGLAVLPGVVMIDMARLLTELLIGKRIKITFIDKAKFTKQIHPSSTLCGEVRIKEQQDDIQVIATLKKDGEMTSTCLFNALIES